MRIWQLFLSLTSLLGQNGYLLTLWLHSSGWLLCQIWTSTIPRITYGCGLTWCTHMRFQKTVTSFFSTEASIAMTFRNTSTRSLWNCLISMWTWEVRDSVNKGLKANKEKEKWQQPNLTDHSNSDIEFTDVTPQQHTIKHHHSLSPLHDKLPTRKHLQTTSPISSPVRLSSPLSIYSLSPSPAQSISGSSPITPIRKEVWYKGLYVVNVAKGLKLFNANHSVVKWQRKFSAAFNLPSHLPVILWSTWPMDDCYSSSMEYHTGCWMNLTWIMVCLCPWCSFKVAYFCSMCSLSHFEVL